MLTDSQSFCFCGHTKYADATYDYDAVNLPADYPAATRIMGCWVRSPFPTRRQLHHPHTICTLLHPLGFLLNLEIEIRNI